MLLTVTLGPATSAAMNAEILPAMSGLQSMPLHASEHCDKLCCLLPPQDLPFLLL